VCWDRRREIVIDEAGVVEKYGVRPPSIPDWLALVGDSADGIPGIPAWGAKSSSVVLSHYEHIERIPDNPEDWEMSVRGAARLAENLTQGREDATLYRQLAILRLDVPLEEKLNDLEWQGAYERLKELCRELGDERIPERVPRWRKNQS
ncbi:MAG: 5'-3' exonuclease H3TH domain-containing protein, partial [Anaerolineales bacterium]